VYKILKYLEERRKVRQNEINKNEIVQEEKKVTSEKERKVRKKRKKK
jgi:hypothetical protein